MFETAGVYGLGRWGQTLALALAEQGVLLGVSSYRPRRPDELPGPLRGLWTDRLEDLVARVAVLFLTVRDDALEDLVARLASLRGDWSSHAFVHSCGAHGRRVFAPLARRGARVGVLHPLNSFTGPAEGLRLLSQTYFAINADAPLDQWLQDRIRAMGGRSMLIDDSEQPVYHLVAVLVANAPVALAEMARRLLALHGLEQKIPWEAYRPLIGTACQHMQTASPLQRLTGPWIRGDERTIEVHRQVLASAPQQWQDLYRLLQQLVETWRDPGSSPSGSPVTGEESDG